MDLVEFQQLKAKVQELILRNTALQKEKGAFAERLLLRERQVHELKERCERYERIRREAYQRISALLDKAERVK
jgi:hypothetical protein